MNKPVLRFPGFNSNWKEFLINDIFDRVTNPVKVKPTEKYTQIGIRSHGKGLFYKPEIIGKDLGNKSVFWIEPDCFIVNIVFAWERAIAKTSSNDIGYIASHRFPMYKPKKNILFLDFILEYFKTNLGNYKLLIASPGGAGRNKTLGQKEFSQLKIFLPEISEQIKISKFHDNINTKINLLNKKKELLLQYKKGILQVLLSQKVRFKNHEGNNFPDWDNKKLKDFTEFRRGSFPQPYGLKKWYDQVNGKPFVQVFDISNNLMLNENTKNRISDLAKPFSVYAKAGTVIVTIQGSIGRVALTQYDAYIDRTILVFTGYKTKVHKYFFSIIIENLFDIEKRKAPGGIIKTITKESLSNFNVSLPCFEEQKKIASFISSLNTKIINLEKEINYIKQFKKGIQQQMFV